MTKQSITRRIGVYIAVWVGVFFVAQVVVSFFTADVAALFFIPALIASMTNYARVQRRLPEPFAVLRKRDDDDR